MDELVVELKKTFKFAESTMPGDVVLIVMESPQTMIYALVQTIERDESKQDEWWHVNMQLLTFPPQEITWTLRMEQFTGKEIFTMGGSKRFIKALDFSKDKTNGDDNKVEKKGKKPVLRVVK